MNATTERQKTRTIVSWAGSVAIHALLLVIFLLLRVLNPVKEMTKYSEMDFISVPTVARTAHAEDQSAPVLPKMAHPTASVAKQEAKPVIQPSESPENVMLPEMKHLPDETPELTEKKVEKISAAEKPSGGQVRTLQKTLGQQEKYPPDQIATMEGKPVPQAQQQIFGEKPQIGTGTGTDASGDRSYSIEGSASTRQIITEVLPEYPPGLNKEAVIKIRFAVLPNGTIGETVPLQKGEALLEEITLKAFRLWRFNALPADAPQTPQPGIITFRYLLRVR